MRFAKWRWDCNQKEVPTNGWTGTFFEKNLVGELVEERIAASGPERRSCKSSWRTPFVTSTSPSSMSSQCSPPNSTAMSGRPRHSVHQSLWLPEVHPGPGVGAIACRLVPRGAGHGHRTIPHRHGGRCPDCRSPPDKPVRFLPGRRTDCSRDRGSGCRHRGDRPRRFDYELVKDHARYVLDTRNRLDGPTVDRL